MLTEKMIDAAIEEYTLSLESDLRNTDQMRNSVKWGSIVNAMRRDAMREALNAVIAKIEEKRNDIEDFEFYAWIVRAGFLNRLNLRGQMERLGFPDEALGWSLSEAARNHDLVGLYQDHGMASPKAWEAFIADCREKHKKARGEF